MHSSSAPGQSSIVAQHSSPFGPIAEAFIQSSSSQSVNPSQSLSILSLHVVSFPNSSLQVPEASTQFSVALSQQAGCPTPFVI